MIRRAVCLALVAAAANAQAAPKADLLIVGGRVQTGEDDSDPRPADLALSGDRVVFVGDARAAGVTAARTIDAAGLIVAPGFIDPHTHSLGDLTSKDAKRRLNLNYLTQGVTTVVAGNDGDGSPQVADALAKAQGIGSNLALYVGFGGVRKMVLGEDARAPTPAELDRMRALVARGMDEGAVGFSTGLYYAPQSFAKTGEVAALAYEAAARGGLYDTHMRDEGTDSIGVEAAVDEALAIGREAKMPVHIAHLKALGVDAQGKGPALVARIEAARAAGQDVTADQYPWRASGTHISAALAPRWIMDGGEAAMLARLADPALAQRIAAEMADNLRRRGGPQSLLIVNGKAEWNGKTLADLAKAWNLDPVAAAQRILREGDAGIASFNMAETDLRAIMVQPWVMTSSDGTNGHPRKYGSFSEKYARYVRGAHLLTDGQFIWRSSGLTAKTLGLKDRGCLRVGCYADVTVFDPQTFAARADYAQPALLSVGVVYQTVNGVLTIDKGSPTGAAPGRGLKKTAPRS